VASTDKEIKDYANIISRIVDLALKLKQSAFTAPLSQLKTTYEAYLQSYIDMIDFLKTTIRSLIGELRDTVVNGLLFSFLVEIEFCFFRAIISLSILVIIFSLLLEFGNLLILSLYFNSWSISGV